MSSIFQGGAGSPVNRDDSLERVGISSSGALTSVTSGASNAKGASWTNIGSVITGPFSGFTLIVAGASNSNTFLADISLDGGTTIHVPDLYLMPTVLQAGFLEIDLPLNVAAGAQIAIKLQSSAATQALTFGVIGKVTNANSQPLWTQCEPIVAVNKSSATRVSSVPLTLAAGAGSWVDVQASTARAYGAMLGVVGQNLTSPTVLQQAEVQFSTGASGSEVWFNSALFEIGSSTPLVARANAKVIQKAIAATTKIRARTLTTSAGTPDTVLANMYGFF